MTDDRIFIENPSLDSKKSSEVRLKGFFEFGRNSTVFFLFLIPLIISVLTVKWRKENWK